jgi:hypothetical protein
MGETLQRGEVPSNIPPLFAAASYVRPPVRTGLRQRWRRGRAGELPRPNRRQVFYSEQTLRGHKRKEASGDRLRSRMQILPGYMNSPERIRYCLANAAECERAAVATALRTNVRAHYLHLARQWRVLAADMMAVSRGERIR